MLIPTEATFDEYLDALIESWIIPANKTAGITE